MTEFFTTIVQPDEQVSGPRGSGGISRREFLRLATLLGTSYAAAQVLAACGPILGPSTTPTRPTTPTAPTALKEGRLTDDPPELEKITLMDETQTTMLARKFAENAPLLLGMALSMTEMQKFLQQHVQKRGATEAVNCPDKIGHHWDIALLIASAALGVKDIAGLETLDTRFLGVSERLLNTNTHTAHFAEYAFGFTKESLEEILIGKGLSLEKIGLSGVSKLAEEGLTFSFGNGKKYLVMILRLPFKNNSGVITPGTAFIANRKETILELAGWIGDTGKNRMRTPWGDKVSQYAKDWIEKIFRDNGMRSTKDLLAKCREEAKPKPTAVPATSTPAPTAISVLQGWQVPEVFDINLMPFDEPVPIVVSP